MFKISGASKFNKTEKAQINDLIQFTLDKFFSKRLQNVLEIDIIFSSTLLNRANVCGDCIWEDRHFKPREFTIRLDSTLIFSRILNTLAHELVHVKQWAKGEMFELQRQSGYKFNNQVYNSEKISYWELPWEIEAHGRAVGIVNQWALARKFSGEICDKIIYEG